MGGLYGLMYHATVTDEPFDLAKRLRPGLASLGRLARRTAESCEAAFDACMLGQDELNTLADEAIARAWELIGERIELPDD